MRLVYYGTPALAVPPLRRLVLDGRAPLLVVTRPDRPRGRGLASSASPVKEAALELGLPVETPPRAGAPEALERVRALQPDLLIVAAYGQIFPRALLAVPRLGALNVHYSLLPRHRGAAPVQAALLSGDAETGVTTMWMTEGLDEGPVFLSRSTAIAPGEDAGALGARLAALGAECLAESLDRIEAGEILREEQDPARATMAGKIRAADARLDPGESPEVLARRVRAFAPEPGAHFVLMSSPAAGAPSPEAGAPAAGGSGDRLLVLAAEPGSATRSEVAPGTLLAIDRARGMVIALPQGSLWLLRVKPAGRKTMSGAEYANGKRLKPGDRLPLATGAAAPGARSKASP
ncbi:MAG TPA: methionyl-tRNA formyltransferase [Candidatus Eisenbacteria bacterium]|nr:methionyl-tRNA formyltransferase [Candidatus Eisenbacteria bacterium]